MTLEAGFRLFSAEEINDAIANAVSSPPSSITGGVTPFPITGLAGIPGGNGGNVTLTAGAGGATSGGNGGALTISAGSSLSGTSHGGGLTLNGGNANGTSGPAGAVTVNGGTANSGAGGAIFLFSGNAGSTGVGGVIGLTVGQSGVGVGGNILLEAGNAAGGTPLAGGNINLIPGLPTSTGTPGQVQINGNGGITTATYFFTGTPAATNQVFYVATRPMLVVAAVEVHAVASGGTSTLTVTHDTGSAAPGAGSSVTTGSFNLNGAANAAQYLSPTAVTTLAAGDRLAVNYANAIQSSAGIVVSVSLAPQ